MGEGGLLGLAVSPTYDRDRLVYAYLTTATDNRIVRFRLGGEPENVLTGIPASSVHNGGRLAFRPDGMLYATTGDAADGSQAQELGSLGGKVLRMRPDGTVPDDNPFPDSPVWSLGHRNVQGIAWDGTGRMFASEFGQSTSDEVNRIEPGRNYGWPDIEGRREDAGGDAPEAYLDPLLTWAVDEGSPSGAAVADGSLWVGALRGERLWRVPLTDDGLGEPESMLEGVYGRIRTVARAPDGSLWLLTSNRDGRGDPVAEDDRIIRLPLP